MSASRSLVLLLLCSLASVGQPATARTCRSYYASVRVINKAALSPERLADALYAKSVFANDPDARKQPLREAAMLAPNDPVYVFRLLPTAAEGTSTLPLDFMLENAGSDKERNKTLAMRKRETDRQRAILERTLAIDPNCLPALYKYALTKPTPAQRIAALEAVARIDSHNAKPYYIMAILRYESIVAGRRPIRGSETGAYSLSHEEWTSILDALKQGNARPVLRATLSRVPSARDIAVSTRGKAWPRSAVEGFIGMMLNELGIGELDETPWSFTVNAMMRQLARQAVWEADQLSKQGKRQEAEDTLQVIYGFSDKLATSEPHRMIPLLVAVAIRAIARSEGVRIAESAGDAARVAGLRRDEALCKRVLERETMAVIQGSRIKVPGIRLSRREVLSYSDTAAEEAGVTRVLKELCLSDKAGGDR